MTAHVKCCQPGELIRRSVSGAFTGGSSCRYLCLAYNHISSHCLSKEHSHSESSFQLVMLGTLLKSRFPAQTSAHTDFQGIMHTCMLGRVQFFRTPWTAARQAPLSMEFSKQEYCSGLPFPPPGIFPTQGLNLGLPHCRRILYDRATRGTSRGVLQKQCSSPSVFLSVLVFLPHFWAPSSSSTLSYQSCDSSVEKAN